MKWLPLIACLWAAPLSAQSLCDVTDPDRIAAVLQGVWTQQGSVSIETETLSVTQGLNPQDRVDVSQTLDLRWPLTDQWLREALPLIATTPMDVDTVDDLLTTVDADWIADAVGDTRCGPENLPQYAATFDTGMATGDDTLSGTITLIPYFEDRVVLLAQIEMRGAWGLGFVTAASLLTR